MAGNSPDRNIDWDEYREIVREYAGKAKPTEIIINSDRIVKPDSKTEALAGLRLNELGLFVKLHPAVGRRFPPDWLAVEPRGPFSAYIESKCVESTAQLKRFGPVIYANLAGADRPVAILGRFCLSRHDAPELCPKSPADGSYWAAGIAEPDENGCGLLKYVYGPTGAIVLARHCDPRPAVPNVEIWRKESKIIHQLSHYRRGVA